MYNLAIALGIAVLAYALTAAVAGWLAGFVPGLLAAGIAYYLLARRTGQQLEALMQKAGEALQGGRIDEGRAIIEQGFALGKWQFLVAEQLHAQLGAIDYLQRRFDKARPHLEKSWSRNWMSQAMLACVDHREGKHDAALARMEKTVGPGEKDPTFWALYCWLAMEAGDTDRALRVVSQGLGKTGNSAALSALADSLRNKKRVKPQKLFTPFAPGWYQFFPEHMPPAQMAQMAGVKAPGYAYPQPRGFRR